MYKINVYIENEEEKLDTNVNEEIQLSFLPRKGDELWLSTDVISSLEKQATSDFNIAIVYKKYIAGFFWNEDLKDEEMKEMLRKLDFIEASKVVDFIYSMPDNKFHIVLGNNVEE